MMSRYPHLLLVAATTLHVSVEGFHMIPHDLFSFQDDPSPEAYCLLSRLMQGAAVLPDAKCCNGHVTEVGEPCAGDINDNMTFTGLNGRMFEYCDEYTPQSVLVARNTRDVQMALLFARRYKKQFQVRSGGHSGRCTSTCQDCIVIDLQQMKGFERVVAGNGNVYFGVEPGNTLQDVFFNYLNYDEFFPHGQGPTVGIGGHVGGGGVGQATRLHGAALDFVVGVEIVLASGMAVTVYDEDHELHITGASHPSPWNKWRQDLLWATRGNGHANFGIVTKYMMRTVPRPKFRVIGSAEYLASEAEIVSLFWERTCRYYNGSDNARLTVWPLLVPSATGLPQQAMRFIFYYMAENSSSAEAALAEGRPVIDEYMQGVPFTPLFEDVSAVPDAYVYGEDMYKTPEEVGRTVYQCVSRFIDTQADVCANQTYLDLFRDTMVADGSPAAWYPLGHFPFVYFEPWGGELSNIDPNYEKTSFAGRHKWGSLQYCRWPVVQGLPLGLIDPVLEQVNQTLMEPIGNSWYINYGDKMTTTHEHLYPNEEVFHKLQRIKRKYDRNNVFNSALSVPVAGY